MRMSYPHWRGIQLLPSQALMKYYFVHCLPRQSLTFPMFLLSPTSPPYVRRLRSLQGSPSESLLLANSLSTRYRDIPNYRILSSRTGLLDSQLQQDTTRQKNSMKTRLSEETTVRVGTYHQRLYFLEIVTEHPKTHFESRGRFCVFHDVAIVRCTTFVEIRGPENRGPEAVYLQTVAFLSLGYLNRVVEAWWKDYEVVIANNSNFREAQWQTFDLPDLGMD